MESRTAKLDGLKAGASDHIASIDTAVRTILRLDGEVPAPSEFSWGPDSFDFSPLSDVSPLRRQAQDEHIADPEKSHEWSVVGTTPAADDELRSEIRVARGAHGLWVIFGVTTVLAVAGAYLSADQWTAVLRAQSPLI